MEETQDKNQQKPNSFIGQLAQKLGVSANASTIYGEPVERGGVTVIPVSKASYAFGGGMGSKAGEEGSGGGGAMSVSPIGYIEITDGSTRFKAIRDPQTLVKIIAVSGVAAVLITRGIGKMLRRSD